MIYLRLFWSFCKIGFTSFGGLSMIPLISSEMITNGWMTASEVTDIVAIAEMTPGPLGLNCASFAGLRAAGVLGAVVSNLGVLAPTLTLCLVAAIFFEKFKDARIMQNIMTGVRPACLAMVVGVCITLSRTNYIINGSLSIAALIITAVDLFLLLKVKVSIPKVILMSGAVGLVVFGLLPIIP